MSTFDDIARLAGRVIRNVKRQARDGVAQSDVIVQRAKAEATTRRRMMDTALRDRRAKRRK